MNLDLLVFDIAVSGLPNMDDPRNVGTVAFVFDGCIVSGWPLAPDANGDVLWEGNRDVSHGRQFAGVTRWLRLPREVLLR